MAEISPNLLLVAGLGVAAYFVWKSYSDAAPKGGSNGGTGGLVGALGSAAVGAAPVASVDDVDSLGGGFSPYQGAHIVLTDPADGGEAEHTPFRNTFALRMYVENHGDVDLNDVVHILAHSDARWIPSGVSTFSTDFGPVKVPAGQRRYFQIPVNFGDDLSLGPDGWDVTIEVSFGGDSASSSFLVS